MDKVRYVSRERTDSSFFSLISVLSTVLPLLIVVLAQGAEKGSFHDEKFSLPILSKSRAV